MRKRRREHAWERETFRVQVRAGTGQVSTANSKPTRDWETADDSGKQTHSMPPERQSQTSPAVKEKTEFAARKKKNHWKVKKASLPRCKNTIDRGFS